MMKTRIDELVDQFRQGDLSRRSFVRRATALGLSATAAGALVQRSGAQDASPAAGGVLRNEMTLESYNAQLAEQFAFEEPANRGGQIIYGQTTDLENLNPVIYSSAYASQIMGLVYESLVGVSVIDASLIPSLAEGWEIAEDGVTYTFTLRQGITWHDGTPFTAEDVIVSYDKTLGEGSLFPGLSGVKDVLSSYRKVDDFTVELVSKDVLRAFIQESGISIFPAHLWKDVAPADFPTDPGSTGIDPSRTVGTGPFKFVEWVQADHLTLARNDGYWDSTNTPVVDELIYRVIPEASANIQALITGEVDLIESVPSAQFSDLQANPDLKTNQYDSYRFNYYALNQDPAKNSLFTDVRVRQALFYAIDRDLIAESIYFGQAIRADGTQPILSFAYAPEQMNTIYLFDPEKAKSLLAEAGWVDSDGDGIVEKDGQKFSFEQYFSEGVAQYEQQIPYYQQSWRDIGVEMFPTAIPFPTLLEAQDSGNYDSLVAGFEFTTTGSQDNIFGGDKFPPAGQNLMRYSNPEYDAITPLEKRALVREEARELLIQQTNIINDDQAMGVVLFRQNVNACRATLHNWFPWSNQLLWSITRAWVEPQ